MSHNADPQYLHLMGDIHDNGFDKGDRTGTGTRSVFGRQMRFDLSNFRIPLLTSKKVFTRGIIHELLWMLSGDTNIRYLKQHGVSIWDSWVLPETAEYAEMTLEERLKHANARALADTNLTALAPQEAHTLLDSVDVPRERLIAGELPKIYQHQWRRWEQMKIIHDPRQMAAYVDAGWHVVDDLASGGCLIRREIDQIQQVIDQLKTNPDSRRIIVSAWNVGEIEEMALPPCHTLFQFWTRELKFKERKQWAEQNGIRILPNGTPTNIPHYSAKMDELGIPSRALSCQLYMRSNDVPLGNPFNIVQYATLTHLLAHVTGMVAEEFIWTGGDVHIYQNQWDGVNEQRSRTPMENTARLQLNDKIDNLFDFTFDDIKIVDYQSHPAIKFPAAAV